MTANMENRVSIPPVVTQMCGAYMPSAGHFDEMINSDGTIRPHWQTFLTALERIGCEELERSNQEVVRLLRENGISFNIHGDPQGVHRKWQLDIIPFIFSKTDWEKISEGITQRTLLLEMVLADIYGSGQLVKEGLLPPELVFQNPGFLRPCSGMPGNPPHRLFMHSADVARGPDGTMWVLGDHTARSSGMGYTLENRTALADVLPDMIRECRVRRLSDFFRLLRDEMSLAAPRPMEDPRIVILSPGPADAGYFEHAYLAAYLGYPVVYGEDLTVRDGVVWLKSLDGLKQVDVIVRQVPDANCDPLELSASSRNGVAGLLEAARRKNVIIVNPVGTSVLENPALLSFLPEISKRLLGEELKLPSVPTWWCGRKEGCDYVLSHLDALIIKDICSTSSKPPVYGSLLSDKDKAEWIKKIQQNPAQYVGQLQMEFSTSPSLEKEQFVPRHTACRLFSVAGSQGGHTLMPGGIARGAADQEDQVVSNRSGGVLKDIWVMTDQPQKHISLWVRGGYLGSRFTRTSVMPSRMGENLFWVGRYAERTEALARMLRTVLSVLSEGRDVDEELKGACLMHLLRGLNQMTLRFGDGTPGVAPIRPEVEISAIIQDRENDASLVSVLIFFLNAAYAVRDHWSTDTWRVISAIEEYRRSIHLYSGFVPRLMQNHLDSLIRSLLAFTGLCMESMSREYGWLLLDTGRRIERALMFIEIIRNNLVPGHETPLDAVMMEAVLATTENVITYRRRYRSHMELATTLDLLLKDDKNPRSLIYQLDQIQEHIAELPREREIRLSEEERMILKATSRLRLSHTDRLAEISEEAGSYKRLNSLLLSIRHLLEQTSEALSKRYFSHVQTSHIMGSGSAGEG